MNLIMKKTNAHDFPGNDGRWKFRGIESVIYFPIARRSTNSHLVNQKSLFFIEANHCRLEESRAEKIQPVHYAAEEKGNDFKFTFFHGFQDFSRDIFWSYAIMVRPGRFSRIFEIIREKTGVR